MFPILENGKWGLMDERGKVVLNARFDAMSLLGGFIRVPPFLVAFENEPILVAVGNKWGYIDKNGNFVSPPQFEEALQFSDGLAAVKVGDKWGYFDQAGKFVIPPKFKDAEGFSEGNAAVCVNSLWHNLWGDCWGYIDKTGCLIIRPHFYGAGHFLEGIAFDVACSYKRDHGGIRR